MMIIEVVLTIGLIVLVLWANVVLSPMQAEVEKVLDDSRYPPYLPREMKASSHRDHIV
jgi:hypothetical protein